MSAVRRLSTREKLLTIVAIQSVIIMVWVVLVYDPLTAKIEANREASVQLSDAIAAQASNAHLALPPANASTPTPEWRNVQEQLQRQEVQWVQLASEIMSSLTQRQMLIELLAAVSPSTLVQFKTLVPVRLDSLLGKYEDVLPMAMPDVQPYEETSTFRRLYRHGIQFDFDGDYADLLAYLQALDASNATYFWGDVDVNWLDLNRVRATLIVYLWSDQPAWQYSLRE